MKLAIPTIHLNGTSKGNLLDAIDVAYSKLIEARQALTETAPNGRDYYVQEPGALEVALQQHWARMDKLNSVLKELQDIALGISDQGR